MSASDTFPKLLLRHAAERPHAVVVRRKRFGLWQATTWRQAAEHVRDTALGLRALGLGPGDRIALLGGNGPEGLWTGPAAQAIGAIPLGIYADTPAAPMRDLVAFAGARAILALDQQQVDKVLEVRDRLPHLEAIVYSDTRGMREYRHPGLVEFSELTRRGREVAAGEPGLFAEWVDKGDGAAVGMLVTTSGTSGVPKLAMHAHRSLIVAAEMLNRIDPLGPTDEHVSYLPLAWAGEQIGVALALVAGMRVNFPAEP